MVEIIEILLREHQDIENLLRVMEQELSIFDRGERPDYEVLGIATWRLADIALTLADRYGPPSTADFEEQLNTLRRNILELEEARRS
jgi:hypothetical protein